MIKIKQFSIQNIDMAIYGMRLPLMSHDKSDSYFQGNNFILGNEDLKLMKKLRKAGNDHRKFLRQIFVSITTVAPMYWELERDTYKVATTKNSSSKMHKLMSRHVTMNDFSMEDITTDKEKLVATQLINLINNLIDYYKVCSDDEKEKTFRKVIQLLPESFNYECVWTGSLENLLNIYKSRKNHKLSEWREFCKMLEADGIFRLICLDE